MKKTFKPKTQYYQSYTDDFVESGNQSFQLPDSYTWIRDSLLYRIASKCIYTLAVFCAFIYCRCYLHIRIKNRSVLKQYPNSGYFLYCNHTQPVGDAFIPLRVLAPRRCYILAAPANLGIPILGRLLPMIGALPAPDSLSGMKKLHDAIRLRIQQKKCVVIYPEAHVWPWYTGIRPYPAASFGFPTACDAPSFCMTAAYQKRKHAKRPKMTLYLDGPFLPDHSLPLKERKERLRQDIYECMVKRSQNSNYEYIHYENGEA